jgi:hypothetical protein
MGNMFARPSLNKADLVYLLFYQRRAPETLPSLWQTSGMELAHKTGALTEQEKGQVARLHEARARWKREHGQLRCQDLRALAHARGLPTCAGITRDGLIDLLCSAPERPKLMLDEDQQAALERREPELFLHAGPGSGKTTTVCEVAARAWHEDGQARVLLLVFNREARDVLLQRLRADGVPIIPKGRVACAGNRGCAVLTFDEWGYRVQEACGRNCGCDGEPEGHLGPEDDEDLFARFYSELELPSSPALGSDMDGSYRQKLAYAARHALRSPASQNWDLLLLDEAQDIMPQHEAFIEGVLQQSAPRLFVAGDPRQELYPGARWFSRRYAAAAPESRATLRYNHRSDPEIVEALNRYSRANFPTLHVEQIAAKATSAKVPQKKHVRIFYSGDLVACGVQAGKLMSAAAPGRAYAIAPVSINKWCLEQVSGAARQQLYEKRPGEAVMLLNASSPPASPKAYIFATASKLKGRERPVVVVYGLGVKYKICAQEDLKKRLYVALSRAQDYLCILLPAVTQTRGHTHTADALACRLLAPLLGSVCPASRAPKASQDGETGRDGKEDTVGVVTVADREEGLASIEGLYLPAVHPRPSVPRLTVESVNDADFVGLYLEAYLAGCLGARTLDRRARIVGCARRARQEIVCAGGHWVVAAGYPLHNTLHELGTLLEEGRIHPAYYDTAVRFTLLINKRWTVSERLEAIEPENPDATAEGLRRLAGKIAPVHGASRRHQVTAHRSGVAAAVIQYVPDLLYPHTLVELKHTRGGLTDVHRRQTAIYAALCGHPSGYLINLYDGAAEQIEALPLTEVELHARALHCLREARTRHVCLSNNNKKGVCFQPAGAYLIAVDVETDGGAWLTEIGAVAFTAGSHEPIAAFHLLADGVVSVDGEGLFGTGLAIADETRLTACQASLRERYWEWAGKISPACTLLHWGGREDALKRPGDQTLDVLYRLFRPWLAQNNSDTRTAFCKQADAIDQLGFPDSVRPVPHRAYEDALQLAMVYVTCVNAGGVC